MSQLFEDRAVRYISDFIRDFQLEDYQAAGFPGNFGEETGGFQHVQEISPIGGGQGGLGDNQATGPRRRRFEAWLARNKDKGWTASTYEANYSFVWRELTGQPGESDESAALRAVRAARDVDEAAEIVMRKYERPNPNYAHLDVRQKYARQALNAFRARGIDVAALKAMGRPGAITPSPHDVLSPLPKIDPSALAPVIQALMPVLMQLIASRTQQSAGQPGQQPDILSILLPLLTGGQQVLPPPAPSAPAEVVVTTPSAKPKTSVAVGLGGIFASLGAMATGHLGTPLGMGTDPTVAGNLVPLAFGAIAAIGSTGVFGPWGAVAGRVLGAVGTAVANKPKT